jgi:hypothetical protein
VQEEEVVNSVEEKKQDLAAVVQTQSSGKKDILDISDIEPVILSTDNNEEDNLA